MYIKLKNSKQKAESRKKGFTLLEILVVIAIFGIVAAIVIFNYGKFTNDTVLTNMAYEMSLSIREAQIFGVAVSGRSQDFSQPFGVVFDLSGGGETDQYFLFVDENRNGKYDSSSNETVVGEPYKLQRNVKIVDVATCTSIEQCIEVENDKLSITFQRPNPEPEFNPDDGASYAKITLQSPEGTKRCVMVSINGQVYVESDSGLCD